MDFLLDISLFFLKSLIVAAGLLALVLAPLLISQKKSRKKKVEIEDLRGRFKGFIQEFQQTHQEPKDYKKYLKAQKKAAPAFDKKKAPSSFVLSFNGDKMASQVESLRDEVSLILQIAQPEDEAILLLESPGGSVASYGLAASQLVRLREKLRLTICVDTVAASGGYLMAVTGHQILSAPFAFIGSIGVLFQTPNLHEFLKKRDISFEEITAGAFKRTVTPFGKVTPEKRQKLQEQMDRVHIQFQDFARRYRKDMDFERVATGEVWLGAEALKLHLVDKIQCSDDYILQALKTRNVYKITFTEEKKIWEKLTKKLSLFHARQLSPEEADWKKFSLEA